MKTLKIIYGKDCWGSTSYFGYKGNDQHTEDYETIEDLKEDYQEFTGCQVSLKNNAGYRIRIEDKNNLLTSSIIEAMQEINETIYFNEVDCNYWIMDFKIENIWFKSTEIDLNDKIIKFNCFK